MLRTQKSWNSSLSVIRGRQGSMLLLPTANKCCCRLVKKCSKAHLRCPVWQLILMLICCPFRCMPHCCWQRADKQQLQLLACCPVTTLELPLLQPCLMCCMCDERHRYLLVFCLDIGFGIQQTTAAAVTAELLGKLPGNCSYRLYITSSTQSHGCYDVIGHTKRRFTTILQGR